jgi:recombination protein RecR
LNIPEPLERVIEELTKLPSVGKKTAQRLALFLLKSDPAYLDNLISAMVNVKEKLSLCEDCFNISMGEKCEICKNSKRDRGTICVVEEVSDVLAIERTNEYSGLYHVLGGVLSPLSGKDAGSIKLKELIARTRKDQISEVILALNPDTEGETTSLYIAKLLRDSNIKVSRIARGLPIGGDLEFADNATIGRAVLSRTILE